MIILCSATVDPTYSPLVLDTVPARDRLAEISRRVTRTATLDGSAVLYDNGFSHADRVLTFAVKQPSSAVVASVRALMAASGTHSIATSEGRFSGVLERVSLDTGDLVCRFLVTSKDSA